MYTVGHSIHACKLYVVGTTICPPLSEFGRYCIGNIDEQRKLNRIDASVSYVHVYIAQVEYGVVSMYQTY